MEWLENRYAKVPNRFHHDGFDYRNTRRCIPEFSERILDPKSPQNKVHSKLIPNPATLRTEHSRAGAPTGNILETSVLPAFPLASLSHRLLLDNEPKKWRGYSFTPEPRPIRKAVPLVRAPPLQDWTNLPFGKSRRVADFSDLAGRASSASQKSARKFFAENSQKSSEK